MRAKDQTKVLKRETKSLEAKKKSFDEKRIMNRQSNRRKVVSQFRLETIKE
jgi:hypothetical protein